MAASGLSDSLLLLVCPAGPAEWEERPLACLTALSGEVGDVPDGEGGGDCSPAAWSSMRRLRLPCVLLLNVPADAAAGRLAAGWWWGCSVLLGPAVAPVTQEAKDLTRQRGRRVFQLKTKAPSACFRDQKTSSKEASTDYKQSLPACVCCKCKSDLCRTLSTSHASRARFSNIGAPG